MKILLRALGFFLGLALLVHLSNTLFVQTDVLAYLSLHELTHRDDIDLAFVGSSVARNHFVPDVIREGTGLEPFNLGLPFMAMQGDIASAKLLFDHHQPEWTVLVAEPFLFNAQHESLQTQFRLMPFITNPIDKAVYYWDLCRQDDRWLDRLMISREFGVESMDDIRKGLDIRFNPDQYFEKQRQEALTRSPSSRYHGNGFMYPNARVKESELLKLSPYRSQAEPVTSIPDYFKSFILRFASLCKKNDTRLMVIYYPYHTSTMLAEPNYLAYGELLKAFCEEQSIPFFNFVMARKTLLPTLDSFYENNDHMDIEGATALSQAFCEVFRRYTSGEDVSGLFYSSIPEYLASIDRMVNVWFDSNTENGYSVDSHHGSQIVPEYCFALIDADGSETIVQAYSHDPVYRGSIPEGATLRAYARTDPSDPHPIYKDL